MQAWRTRRASVRRAVPTVRLIALVAVALPAVLLTNVATSAALLSSLSSSPYAPGSPAEFAYLSQQTSNACGLQQSTVLGYPDSIRLQGSCCDPMDMARYQSQVQDLRSYAAISAIVADPYDVPVALAKRLLGYEQSIRLTPAQQATFNRAMSKTDDHGPCCCHCWRWHTTTGLAKYLIVDRRFPAPEVTTVVDLVNGCGGPLDHRT